MFRFFFFLSTILHSAAFFHFHQSLPKVVFGGEAVTVSLAPERGLGKGKKSAVLTGSKGRPGNQSSPNRIPPYPQEAIEQEWEGTVHLEIEIDTKGHTKRISVAESSGYEILDQTAEDAAWDWHWEGSDSTIRVPVEFVLK